MVQKQERLYIPKSDDYDEGEDDSDETYYLDHRLAELQKVSNLRKVTAQTVADLFTSGNDEEYKFLRGSQEIPLEKGKLTLKRPSLGNCHKAVKIIGDITPQVSKWLYYESYSDSKSRKLGSKDYTSTPMDHFKEEIAIIPLIFFRFDYRILAFSEKDNLFMGLAKIGKATGYHMSWNKYILDTNESPFFALILTAQSSQDLDTLETKLGLG